MLDCAFVAYYMPSVLNIHLYELILVCYKRRLRTQKVVDTVNNVRLYTETEGAFLKLQLNDLLDNLKTIRLFNWRLSVNLFL